MPATVCPSHVPPGLAAAGSARVRPAGGAAASAEGAASLLLRLLPRQRFAACFQIPHFKASASQEADDNSHLLKQDFSACLRI